MGGNPQKSGIVNMANFFGYGSLVNLRTHNYQNPKPTQVIGWQREWVSSTIRDVAFLSVKPSKKITLQGMSASTKNIGWKALDIRETGYYRHKLINLDMQMYIGDPKTINNHVKQPILLSYLDCVIQGYHEHFGEQGVIDFFATTFNWDHPIFNDRNLPQYPRAITLNQYEQDLVDYHLAQL